MFLIIPVQVRWLAILIGSFLLIGLFAEPWYVGFLILGFANYLLWAAIPAIRGRTQIIKSADRKKKFDKNKLSEEGSFHRCAACGETELTDPDLEFRMAEDGKEYCEHHLKN
jgi:hypothetical protein